VGVAASPLLKQPSSGRPVALSSQRRAPMTTTVPVLRCVVTVTVVRGDDLRSHGWRSKNQAPYVVVRAMQDLRPLCATERTSAVGGRLQAPCNLFARSIIRPPALPQTGMRALFPMHVEVVCVQHGVCLGRGSAGRGGGMPMVGCRVPCAVQRRWACLPPPPPPFAPPLSSFGPLLLSLLKINMCYLTGCLPGCAVMRCVVC
jgi:hypothetical protein